MQGTVLVGVAELEVEEAVPLVVEVDAADPTRCVTVCFFEDVEEEELPVGEAVALRDPEPDPEADALAEPLR